MKSGIVLIVTTLALALTSCAQDGKSPTTGEETVASEAPGKDQLPSFRLLAADGSVLQLTDLKGKKIFVNIWATWCPPCRREMPSINALYKSVDKTKVAFVMLDVDDNFEKARTYVASQQLDLPIFYPAEQLPALFNVQGIPATFIFDEKGRLLKTVNGSVDYDTDDFRQLLK